MGPPLAQGLVSISQPHLWSMLRPTQPLSQLHSNTQINANKDIQVHLFVGGLRSTFLLPNALSGQLHIELGFAGSMLPHATAQLTALAPQPPAAHSATATRQQNRGAGQSEKSDLRGGHIGTYGLLSQLLRSPAEGWPLHSH